MSSVRQLPGARRAKLPDTVPPELATRTDQAPTGNAWLHELKLDGYRISFRLRAGKATALTRAGNDWTHRMRSVARAVASLDAREAVLDGEICVLEGDGTTNFQRLQNSLNVGLDSDVVYFAFDLIHVDGWDLRRVPLIERKAELQRRLRRVTDPSVRYSDHVRGSGPRILEQACERGLEGIICKRADSLYVSGRTRDWIKVKCTRRHEVVVGGFTDPRGSRSHFGALLVGTHDERGALIYRGKVGTGYTEDALADLHACMQRLECKQTPFQNPPRGAAACGVHWVSPQLLAEVEYTEVTKEGLLRHPRFKGLRQDKPASDITLE